MIDALRLDLRHAWRAVLAHKGGFGLAAAILAGGLGLTLAMACVLDAVLLRQLPYPHAERVVQVREVTASGGLINLATPNSQDLDAAVPAFTATAIYTGGDAHVQAAGQAVRTGVAWVGGDFFSVFGQAPARGRWLPAGGQAAEVVISHGLWQALGHGDPVINAPWPKLDESALVQDTLQLVIQVNGKLRGHLEVAADASREAVEAAARQNENVLRFTEGLNIRKVIVVPGKLVNIVAN